MFAPLLLAVDAGVQAKDPLAEGFRNPPLSARPHTWWHWLNGHALPVLWKPPFVLNVSGLVRPGANQLEIKVTNLWPNRLIGDEQLSPDVEWDGDHLKRWPDWLVQGKPRPKTGRVAFATWRYYDKNSPLLESGLMGPVTLRAAKRTMLKY